MRALRARWLLPIDRPVIENGWIRVDEGRIVEVGYGRPPDDAADLGDVALLPGLVNAHTHLELSWLRGRIPPSGSMTEWINALLPLRAAGPSGGEAERDRAMRAAIDEMRSTGTVLVGDVSNSLASASLLADSDLGGVIFYELLGFNVVLDAQRIVRDAWRRVDDLPRLSEWDFSVVAHAPYSVSPALFKEIGMRSREAPLSVHLAESAEEIEFLETAGGAFKRLLDRLGVYSLEWQPPRTDPAEYLHRMGYLQPGALIVHAVHLKNDALSRLRDANAVVVTCPRSNEWVGGGIPRIAQFYAAGVRVAIGTDSLASVDSLNLFDELAAMRKLAPDVTAASFLDSATRAGAKALGRFKDYGTLSVGKRARFVVVDVPARTRDVEEYLVSGVPASAVRRFDA